ncbi:MAG: anthranilate synthase component I [Nitrospinae bacterium]|nr:anthranilate synthase component I [Nitrospinota bacterium]
MSQGTDDKGKADRESKKVESTSSISITADVQSKVDEQRQGEGSASSKGQVTIEINGEKHQFSFEPNAENMNRTFRKVIKDGKNSIAVIEGSFDSLGVNADSIEKMIQDVGGSLPDAEKISDAFEDLPEETLDDLDVPDSQFVITDTLLVFDNISQTIKIVSNAFIEGDDLESVYKNTIKKITSLEEKLKAPLAIEANTDSVENSESSLSFGSNIEEEKFKQAVSRIKEYILEGDAIQVVLSQRLKFSIKCDPFDIYRALRTINPSPYMYYLKFGDLQVVGSSPEVLVRLEDKKVEVRPIAGTRKRGQNEEEDRALEQDLLKDEKELAEHIMLVDLGRNDLGRVSEISTVEVNERFTIERYSHVMHIVSNVKGILKKGLDCFDVLKASFPAGTLSGAPKIRAMEIIDELEPTRRGLYGGAVGYISFNGNMDTAIAIRTLLVKDKNAYLGVGAGVVADSVPENEFEETMNKGRALLKAIEMAEKGWLA